MSNPVTVGVIGLGESGQNHLEVICGDRVPKAIPPASTGFDLKTAGRRLARRILRRDRNEAQRPVDRGVQSLQVLAVTDVDEGRLASVQQKFGVPHTCTDYRKLLARNDVEAVLICTPP